MRDLMSYLVPTTATIVVALVALAILFFGGAPSLLGLFLLTVAVLIVIGALCRDGPELARFNRCVQEILNGCARRERKRWARQKFLKHNDLQVKLRRIGAGSFIHLSDRRFNFYRSRDRGDLMNGCA